MRGHLYKPGCKCDKNKKCTCKATWSYIVDIGIAWSGYRHRGNRP